MSRVFTGEIRYARAYPYAMSSEEIALRYMEERLLFMNWLQRLVFQIKQTWLLLRGKRHFMAKEVSHAQDQNTFEGP